MALSAVNINGPTGSLAGTAIIDTNGTQQIIATTSGLNLPSYSPSNRPFLILTDDKTVALSSNVDSDLSAVIASAARAELSLFDDFADVNNGTTVETDLITHTISAGKLATNGDKLFFDFAGNYTGAATATQQLRVKFAGTTIFDSGALSIGAVTSTWRATGMIIRVQGGTGAGIVRCIVEYASSNVALSVTSTYTAVGSLTLTGTNILKVTGQAAGVGAASNQITSKMGNISYLAH